MHLEATAVLLGAKLRDFGGKLTIPGSHIGPILGPSSAILWVMLKLSCAIVGHVMLKLCGYVGGFVFQMFPSRITKSLSGFWRVMLDPSKD